MRLSVSLRSMQFEDHLTRPAGPRRAAQLRRTPAPPAVPRAATSCGWRCAWRATASSRPASTPRAAPPRAAAGSAAVELVEGEPFLDAARVTPDDDRRRSWAACPAEAPRRRAGRRRAAPRARRRRARRRRALAPEPRRTLVAMSGGVDSAAAAQLALDAGDDVVAVTLELWSDPATDGERSCCSPQAVTGARGARPPHGHPAHHARPARALPRRGRRPTSSTGYAAGRTPNPCVRCNGHVRFDAMLALAERLGAARLATGHYARIARDEQGPLIRAAADPRKDQSYMLAKLDPAQLERLSFPLGGLTKDAVRALAREAGLPVADKRESQDLCFVAGLGGRAFLRRHGGPRLRRPGEIVDARRAACSAATTASTASPSASGAGSASAPPSRSTCSPRTPRRNRVTVGPRAALARTHGAPGGRQLHRAGRRRRGRCGCATTPAPLPCRRDGQRRRRARAGARRARRARWRPGSWPA